jgi:hypothetical protein
MIFEVVTGAARVSPVACWWADSKAACGPGGGRGGSDSRAACCTTTGSGDVLLPIHTRQGTRQEGLRDQQRRDQQHRQHDHGRAGRARGRPAQGELDRRGHRPHPPRARPAARACSLGSVRQPPWPSPADGTHRRSAAADRCRCGFQLATCRTAAVNAAASSSATAAATTAPSARGGRAAAGGSCSGCGIAWGGWARRSPALSGGWLTDPSCSEPLFDMLVRWADASSRMRMAGN